MANIITIENTRFIFDTHFSGDPNLDKFRSTQRYANLVIPDINLARQMIDMGCNVKLTRPKEGEEEGFEPRYFVRVVVNYESEWPPKVYLVSGDADPVMMNGDTIGMLDKMWIKNVNVQLNLHPWTDGISLYVKTMYVEQSLEDDPFAARYMNREIYGN
ncbi:MAG: hypothetical protein MR531_12105 [Lachnospiraceae bacterium]|nr:hypothetical protein [Lachnospiraceae bacterium]